MFIEIIQGFMLEKVREAGCRKTVDSYRLEDPGFITVTWRVCVCVCARVCTRSRV